MQRPEQKKQSYQVEASLSPATLVVSLPADATLTIDDHRTTSTSGVRVFVTPPLSAGAYTYTLNAQIVRDGQPVALTRQVAVRAGEETQVLLEFPTTSLAVAP